MANALLTLNLGSSSIKYALYPLAAGAALLQGEVSGLNRAGPKPHHWQSADRQETTSWPAALSAAHALQQLLPWIAAWGAAQSLTITTIIHRVVHGGPLTDTYAVRLDTAKLAALHALTPLAPLHQPYNLQGVAATQAVWPAALQLAAFDNAFHASLPPAQTLYALPASWRAAGVRRYGFHGLSYASVARRYPEGRILAAHLGSGCSVCALLNGQSVATSMGFSALGGLPMSTRSGDLDPGVLLFALQNLGLDAAQLQHTLYHESGLAALHPLGADMQALEAASQHDDTARATLDYFYQQIAAQLAALIPTLGGLPSALVLTGGIGENSQALKNRLAQLLGWLNLPTITQTRTDEAGELANLARQAVEQA